MRQLRFRPFMLGLALAIAVLLAIYLFFDRIIICPILKTRHIKISYENFKKNDFREFIFSSVKILDETRGVGFSSRYAAVRPRWKFASPFDVAFSFDLRDVSLIKREPEGIDVYDELLGLVSVPFKSCWTYKEISGDVRLLKKGIHIDDLVARSDEIRFSLMGDINYDNTMKADIVIYFSQKLSDKVPNILSKVILNDEGEGWKSLAVSLSGNYKSPSIQVSSKLFRLDVKSVSKPAE